MRRGYRRCEEKVRTIRELRDKQFDSCPDAVIKMTVETDELPKRRGGNGTRPFMPHELDEIRAPQRSACA